MMSQTLALRDAMETMCRCGPLESCAGGASSQVDDAYEEDGREEMAEKFAMANLVGRGWSARGPVKLKCRSVIDDCEDVDFVLEATTKAWAGTALQRSGEALGSFASLLVEARCGESELCVRSARAFMSCLETRVDSAAGREALRRPLDDLLAACFSCDSVVFAAWVEAGVVVDEFVTRTGGGRHVDLRDAVIPLSVACAGLTCGRPVVRVDGLLSSRGRETTVLRVTCVAHDCSFYDVPFHLARVRALHARAPGASVQSRASIVLQLWSVLSQITSVSQEARIHSLRETLKRDDHPEGGILKTRYT